MPHQCVKCGEMYDDGSSDILKGFSCGGKLFFYIRKEKLKEKQPQINLSKKQKEQIEKDVYDIMGEKIDRDKPIVLDIESVNILRPGSYELDLVSLFNSKNPLVYKLEEGKYLVDIAETFKKMNEEKKR